MSPASHLQSLLESFPRPIDQKALDNLVEKALKDSKLKVSPENRKSHWEYELKNEIFTLAAAEGRALDDVETKYYGELRDRLDLVLTFTEHDACEQTFPFTVLQDLLETQTIVSCSHIFSWIEARSARLTEGMVPQKGKALILLRTLNDLLRRLSKMGSNTIFCGRILTFLSGVLPLGERSGVNLRGEYGPVWEGVREKGGDRGLKEENDRTGKEDMQVDEEKAEEDGKRPTSWGKGTGSREDFYTTFWSLQLPFSKPPLFAIPSTFNEFKDAVNKVIPVIKEATAKERAMMGSRSLSGNTGAGASLKRKREPEADGVGGSDYFFAKFLTSPELLELEIADTHFRRQFISQLLILLNHLLTFTKASKAVWSSPRNRSLQIDFTLEQSETQWVQETINKAIEELRQTTPNGRAFADTVNSILEREKNWVKWKNDLCAPFDREPWAMEIEPGLKVGIEEATKDARKKMREEPKDWDWKYGSEPLTEIWEMGFRDLNDLRNPFQPGDVKDFVKRVKQEDARIEMRKKVLEKTVSLMSAKTAGLKAESPVPPSAVSNTVPAASKDQTTVATTTLEVSAVSDPSANAAIAATPSLHPSLPAKPASGSSAKNTSQDPPSLSTTAPPQRSSPVPASIPVSDSSPASISPLPQPATPTPSIPSVSVSTPPDDKLMKLEEDKQRWSWLALRTARDHHLHLFGKIGTGDIVRLLHEIENDKEKLKWEEPLAPPTAAAGATGAGDERGGSPVLPTPPPGATEVRMEGENTTQISEPAGVDRDVKMEQR